MFTFWKKVTTPEFNKYFPSIEDMSREQIKFYKSLRKSLISNRYVDIEGNISYLFVYLYELLNEIEAKDFSRLYDKLIQFSEMYNSESKVSEYCLFGLMTAF